MGPRLRQCDQGRGLAPYQVAFSSIHSRLATTGMDENWGCVPLGEEAGSPSNKCGQGQERPTAVLSFILIHPAVWPQQTLAENWEAVTR